MCTSSSLLHSVHYTLSIKLAAINAFPPSSSSLTSKLFDVMNYAGKCICLYVCVCMCMYVYVYLKSVHSPPFALPWYQVKLPVISSNSLLSGPSTYTLDRNTVLATLQLLILLKWKSDAITALPQTFWYNFLLFLG